MADRPFGVGLLGVEAGRSWAAIAHIPALRALPADFQIVGVANTSLASAERAVSATRAGRAYADFAEMLTDPRIDLVTVTVKVPFHSELVGAALDAGKAVYCEWPIGNGLVEARAMADRARSIGVPAFAGTQARAAPAMRYVADLIAQGFVGEVLSSTLIGSGMRWGESIDRPNAYILDVQNGATMLTIPFGHVMAAIADALGPIRSLNARLASRRTASRLQETGEILPMTSPDQVLVAATLESGALLSAHYRGGTTRGTGFLWEINGTKGDLQVSANGGQAQLLPLSVKGASGDEAVLHDLSIPASYSLQDQLDARAHNVALVYRDVARDLRTGSRTAPTFDDAVKTHELIDAIERSARDGVTVCLAQSRPEYPPGNQFHD